MYEKCECKSGSAMFPEGMCEKDVKVSKVVVQKRNVPVNVVW